MPTLKEKLYTVIFEADTKAGKTFDLVLLVAILFSVVLVLIDTIPYVHDDFKEYIFWIEWGFTGLFTIEYIIRIYASPSTKKYVFSAYGIIDLVAILPSFLYFFLQGTHFAVILRLIRVIRVFKVLNLKRYMENSQILLRSLIQSFYKIIVFMLIVLIMVVFIGTLMYIIEGPENGYDSIPKSIYWTIVTITTVGFGDITPQTGLGQFVSSIVMLIGYAIIAVPTGIVTVELTKNRNIKSKHPIPCSNCSFTVTNEDNYCKNCGHQLKKEVEVK